MLSTILLAVAVLLLALKLGLRSRLREFGRVIDRWVNIALVVIVVSYAIQLGLIFLREK